MKIRKVVASDFGCLSGAYSFSDDRANVIVEENEQGKSTLVAAILAALYGFPRAREKGKLGDRESHRPWKGGSYQVGLEVEDNDGRVLLIDRDFSEPSGPDGKLRVLEVSTSRDVTEEFRAGKRDFAIGERLLGISREVFLKTCLVKQLEIESVGENSDDLVSKVQQIFGTSGGKGTAAGAMSVLRDEMRKERVALGQRRVSDLDEAIAHRDASMKRLTEERERVAPGIGRLRQLRKRVETLKIRRQELEYLARSAEIAEVESAVREDANNRAELKKLIERAESLRPYSNFTSEQASKFTIGVGRLRELARKEKELMTSLATLREHLETAKSSLKVFEGFEGLNEGFRTQLHDVRTQLETLTGELQRRREQVLDFERSLRAQGYDPSEMDEIRRKFSELTVEEKDLLRDSEARMPRIDAELVRTEATERVSREKLRAIKRPAKAVLALGGVTCAAGLLMLLFAVGFGVGLLVAGGAAVAFALLVFPRLTARKSGDLQQEETAARRQHDELLSQRDEVSRALDLMARKAGFVSPAEMAEVFKRWGRVEDRAARLQSLREGVASTADGVARCRQEASAALETMGLRIAPAEIGLDILRDAENRVGEYLNLLESFRKSHDACTTTEDEIRKLQEEATRLREPFPAILAAANVAVNLPPEDALPRIEEARQKGEEFRRLMGRGIPDLQKKVLSPEKVEGKSQRLEMLRRETEKMAADNSELVNLKPIKTHSEYSEEARRVLEEVGKIKDQRTELFQTVQDVEKHYREEYPRLANEAADLRETLERTQSFRDSVLLAIETLEKISAQSHAQWATVLNQRAGEILRYLNPRCRELKFDASLNFTVVPVEGGQPLEKKHIEAQESVGARHQIYLAVRLALADYLSSAGTKLPVILDDPFATSDDDRFLSGMKFLCREFRKNHQVIILTCHRQRHSELIRQKAPDLLEEMRIFAIRPSA